MKRKYLLKFVSNGVTEFPCGLSVNSSLHRRQYLSSFLYYVINTCTVTSASDEKSRQYIKKVRRKIPEQQLLWPGVMQKRMQKPLKKTEGVDYVIAKTEEARRDTCGSTKRSQNE